LSHNKITNIDILEKVNFRELKELDLYINDFKDISVLEKVKFEKLEVLDLMDISFANAEVLFKVNFPNLKTFYYGIYPDTDLSGWDPRDFRKEICKKFKFLNKNSSLPGDSNSQDEGSDDDDNGDE